MHLSICSAPRVCWDEICVNEQYALYNHKLFVLNLAWITWSSGPCFKCPLLWDGSLTLCLCCWSVVIDVNVISVAKKTPVLFFSFCLVHSLLKSAFNSIAIEKEKLKQIVSEQDLTGHNAQIAHLRQSLSQVCSWFDFKHICLARCTVSFVFWPFPEVKGAKKKPSFQPELWHILLWCRSNLSACGGEEYNLCKHVSATVFQSKGKGQMFSYKC